jgi:transcriptional antiterminator NusG
MIEALQPTPPSDETAPASDETAPASDEAAPASDAEARLSVQTDDASDEGANEPEQAVAAPPAEGEADGAGEAEVEQAPADRPPVTGAKWYAIHVYSGLEQKVLKNIQYRLEIDGLAEHVARALVPTHTVLEIKDGKKVQAERNLMPGYVLIEMMPKEEVFDMISKLGSVAGFVGDGSHPIALQESEVQSLLEQTTHRQDKPKTEILFSKGEQVKIIEGPFAGFTGQLEEIDADRGKLSVMVSIFGRQTAVELDVLQVDRV